jgi:hypothetical protein
MMSFITSYTLEDPMNCEMEVGRLLKSGRDAGQ